MAIIQQVQHMVMDHQSSLAVLGMAVIDLLWALGKGQSNGLLHWAYNALKSIVSPPPAA